MLPLWMQTLLKLLSSVYKLSVPPIAFTEPSYLPYHKGYQFLTMFNAIQNNLQQLKTWKIPMMGMSILRIYLKAVECFQIF